MFRPRPEPERQAIPPEASSSAEGDWQTTKAEVQARAKADAAKRAAWVREQEEKAEAFRRHDELADLGLEDRAIRLWSRAGSDQEAARKELRKHLNGVYGGRVWPEHVTAEYHRVCEQTFRETPAHEQQPISKLDSAPRPSEPRQDVKPSTPRSGPERR